MPQLTTGQWMAILIGILSATAGATAQLTPVFGSALAHGIVSLANLIMTVFVTPILFVVTGQSNLVKTVAAMPGIERITVNQQANANLATVATDVGQPKVGATDPQTRDVLKETAKGG